MPYRVNLRGLGGRDFEELCKTVFERLGYRKVELGPGRGGFRCGYKNGIA
jgi:hypothetical protein